MHNFNLNAPIRILFGKARAPRSRSTCPPAAGPW